MVLISWFGISLVPILLVSVVISVKRVWFGCLGLFQRISPSWFLSVISITWVQLSRFKRDALHLLVIPDDIAVTFWRCFAKWSTSNITIKFNQWYYLRSFPTCFQMSFKNNIKVGQWDLICNVHDLYIVHMLLSIMFILWLHLKEILPKLKFFFGNTIEKRIFNVIEI